jgi:uncharacterized protein YjiK
MHFPQGCRQRRIVEVAKMKPDRPAPIFHLTSFRIAVALLLAAAPMAAAAAEEKSLSLGDYRPVGSPVQVAGVADNLSGLAYNPATKTLWAVLNAPETLLELGTDGKVLRTIELRGFLDTEDVAVLPGGRIAVVEEGRATICHFPLPKADATAVDRNPAAVIKVQDSSMGNTGLEGIAYDAANRRFYVVKEKQPAAIYEVQLGPPGEGIAKAKVKELWKFGPETIDLRDVSACAFDAKTGNLMVLSHESHCLVECTTAGKEISRLDLSQIPQPEGIAMDENRRIYIVSEPNMFYVYQKK